ncbi:MAG: hypothetical protein ACREX0_19785 [Noviherbaspirillum sp.]
MTQSLSRLRVLAAATLLIAAPFAMAGGNPDVSWSLSIGSPYPAPRVVYAPPPPVVYLEPQPVYVRPRPVYVQPAAVVQYGQPYYVEEVRYKKFKHHHWKHRHGHRGHDDDDD